MSNARAIIDYFDSRARPSPYLALMTDFAKPRDIDPIRDVPSYLLPEFNIWVKEIRSGKLENETLNKPKTYEETDYPFHPIPSLELAKKSDFRKVGTIPRSVWSRMSRGTKMEYALWKKLVEYKIMEDVAPKPSDYDKGRDDEPIPSGALRLAVNNVVNPHDVKQSVIDALPPALKEEFALWLEMVPPPDPEDPKDPNDPLGIRAAAEALLKDANRFLKNGADDLLKGVKDTALEALETAKSLAEQSADMAADVAEDIVKRALGVARDAGELALEAAKDAAEDVTDEALALAKKKLEETVDDTKDELTAWIMPVAIGVGAVALGGMLIWAINSYMTDTSRNIKQVAIRGADTADKFIGEAGMVSGKLADLADPGPEAVSISKAISQAIGGAISRKTKKKK